MKKQLLSFLCFSSMIAAFAQTTIVDVTNPVTGATWMDRNLGASQAATSSTDVAAYGDYYQWGRGADGHQLLTSATTTAVSTTPSPGHSDFIVSTVSPHNWFDPSIDELWQGVNGVNNPCPSGYRIPTTQEFLDEKATWSSQDDAGAMNSVLKLPLAGVRSGSFDGSLSADGSTGYYYTSDLETSTTTSYLAFNSSVAGIYNSNRANGMSCRCIKDASASLLDESSNRFSVYPNPTKNTLSVRTDETIDQIQLFNSVGMIVQTEYQANFSIEHLPAGIYILQLQTNLGTYNQRFVKE